MATAEQAKETNGTTTTPAAGQPLPPLWPSNNKSTFKIEIIGVTGEYESGKTLFALTIDPAHTIVYDTEKSSGSYEGLGFTRVDIADEMLKRYPGGYKPIDTFNRWHASIKSLRPGQFRVIVLDTVSEIESGLCDWVRQNPHEFGHTRGQYDKMEGLYWGDVKEYWKSILSDIAARCECFVFTSHLRNVWAGNKPMPGKRAPKGKETLMELASLYLHLERKPDEKGRKPAKPAANVIKSRLAATTLDAATGDVSVLPILPPRLPEATPMAIRAYILSPADYSKLKKGECAVEAGLSADERLLIETQKAEAEATSATAKVNAMELMRAAAAKGSQGQQGEQGQQPEQPQQTAPSTPPQDSTAETTTTTNSPAANSPAEKVEASSPAAEGAEGKDPYQPTRDWAEKQAGNPDPNSPCTAEQRTRIASLFERLAVSPDKQSEILAKVGAQSVRNLTFALADGLIAKLVAHQLGMNQLEPPKN